MAKYKITCEITVNGSSIHSKKSALTQREVMLDDYADMDDTDTEIRITAIDVNRINEL